MQEIRVEKVTLNVGCGKDQGKLEKAEKLIKNITWIEGVKTVTNKRIPEWGLRPGLSVGYKITLRKKDATALLVRLLKARDSVLRDSTFGDTGTISFGIKEYIDIPDVKYDPDIGIMGFEVCVTLERPGFRVKKRKISPSKIPKKHQITKEQAIEYMQKAFGIKVGDEE